MLMAERHELVRSRPAQTACDEMLERHFSTAPAEERQVFAALHERQAPLLMSYSVRRETPAVPTTARVVGVMRALLDAPE